MKPATTAEDYGAAAVDLETVRKLVEQRCPCVHFAGYGAYGAARGEYVFRLGPDHLSVIVQSPLTPAGHQRKNSPGYWRVRLTQSRFRPMQWQPVLSIEGVVDFICAGSQY